ncbi:MAG: DUF2183 domain-containing protein [Deltaproteobacteria bacterium]|nr:DUF2183 domain-containing protein [Deltaproteobacteria bacterium]
MKTFIFFTLLIIFNTKSVAFAKDPIKMLIFTGYGTPNNVYLSGRVLENEGLKSPDSKRSAFKNLVDNVHRLESDEVKGAEIVVILEQQSWQCKTDNDGLWSIEAKNMHPSLTLGTHIVQVYLNTESAEPKGSGEVIIIDNKPSVAIVSDFDDTVVHSYIGNKWSMAKQALLKNPAQQKPIDGVAAVYQAAAQAGAVAFFYVSGSPQNFYERINDFLNFYKIPTGPLLLKNFGSDPLFEQEGYKTKRIDLLMQRFPKLKFILIGDSGEHDPEVYAKTLEKYPNRVAGIFIRLVEKDKSPKERFINMQTAPDYNNAIATITNWVKTK